MSLRQKSKKSKKQILKRAALALVIALCILVPVIRAVKSFGHSGKTYWPRTNYYRR